MRAASLAGGACLLLSVFSGCSESAASGATKSGAGRLLVLGFDGMDPKILQGLLDAGRMPNFARVAHHGTFMPLATSMPPQSPVAWSNFISGSHPGTHQIYDFVHRDPSPPDLKDARGKVIRTSIGPYLSTSDTVPQETPWYAAWLPDPFPWFGTFQVPMSGEQVRLLRKGGDFWTPLVERDIKTRIYRLPATYPPPSFDGHVCACAISGMGTPDVMGSYGEFTLFSQSVSPRGKKVGGGRMVYLSVRKNAAKAVLEGPANFLLDLDAYNADLPKYKQLKKPPPMEVELAIVRDPEADVVKIEVGDAVVVLNEGEWSEWVPIEFATGVSAEWLLGLSVPTRMPAIVRFYAKQVHPSLEIFVTPMNIDPREPVNAISSPESFAAELAEACGPYHTSGIPEHTKIIQEGALNEDQFLEHCRIILDERIKQYRYALEHFDEGFLFFYFGSTDQLAHIFWRDRDPGHPGLKPGEAEKYGHVIDDLYVEMDGLVGEALEQLRDDDTLIIMSDHGFGSFRRGVNVNTWLLDAGYLTLNNPAARRGATVFGADWTTTKAYALGINCLYLNLAGREKNGIVQPEEREALLKEIGDKLLALRDPQDGSPLVEKVYDVARVYPGADPQIAPDLLIGYAENYRGSWSTTLGGIPLELVEDNHDRWSGDHCVAAHLVPGIVVTNRKVTVADPSLSDMAPTILHHFGIAAPAEMIGRAILDE